MFTAFRAAIITLFILIVIPTPCYAGEIPLPPGLVMMPEKLTPPEFRKFLSVWEGKFTNFDFGYQSTSHIAIMCVCNDLVEIGLGWSKSSYGGPAGSTRVVGKVVDNDTIKFEYLWGQGTVRHTVTLKMTQAEGGSPLLYVTWVWHNSEKNTGMTGSTYYQKINRALPRPQ